MISPQSGNPDIEQGLLELFRRELRRAVDDTVGPSDDELDSIRAQKLVLCGIREFELENRVTIQWYLDGDMLPNLPEEDDEVTIITNAGVEDGPFPTSDEVYDFYINGLSDSIPTGETLSEVLEPDAFEWLRDYYEACDIPFSSVYRTNLEIYLKLRYFQYYLDPEHPHDELPGNLTPSNLPDSISEATTTLKQNLIEHPLFQSTPPYVTEFDRITKQILTQINEEIESGDEPRDYHILVSHLGRFYYKAIWQPIADRIGYYTVSAPTENKINETRDFRTQNLQSAHRTFIKELNELRNQAREFNIRFSTQIERLPNLVSEQSRLEDVLSVDMRASGEA